MDVSTMRWADRWLGAPLCLLLTLLRKLAGLFRSRPLPEMKRVLLVKLTEQGATVLAYPAIRRAVQLVGRENVFFAVFQENRFILDVMDLIPRENVIPIPTGGVFSLAWGAIRALRRIRRLRIDTTVDMEFFARSSAAICYLSGARRRVGFHPTGGEAAYCGDLMTHRLSYNPRLHTAQTYLVEVEAATLPVERLPAMDLLPPPADEPVPQFRPAPEEVEEVAAVLRERTGREEIPPLVLLNANCGDLVPLRRWPEQRYVELARRLLERFPRICIAFTGGPGEAAATERLVREVRDSRCFCMAGRTSIRQLLVLYGLSEVLVTNDSGPAHFAALTPIQVVTLFGPETPRLFAARTGRNRVLWSGIACSPCVSAYNGRRSRCRNNICMQRISVDEVLEEVCAACESRARAAKV